METLNFEQIEFLSPDISKAISRVSSEILKPLVKDLKYDECDIDLLFDSTRDKISGFLSKNALVFVSLSCHKGIKSIDLELEQSLN
jgi:hypothetical protein